MDQLNQLSALLTLLTLPIMPMQGHAQDTYNFYFQKEKGPQTVIQGAAPNTAQTKENELGQIAKDTQEMDKSSASDKLSPDSSAVTSEVEIAPIKKRSSWLFGIGAGDTTQSPAGYAIAGEYHFNKYFGLGGEIIIPGKEKEYHDDEERIHGSFGIVLTPIRIHIFDYDAIDIGILAGAMTLPQGSNGYYGGEKNNAVSAYVGPRLSVNLTSDFSLMASVKLEVAKNNESADAQASILAAWKF